MEPCNCWASVPPLVRFGFYVAAVYIMVHVVLVMVALVKEVIE